MAVVTAVPEIFTLSHTILHTHRYLHIHLDFIQTQYIDVVDMVGTHLNLLGPLLSAPSVSFLTVNHVF